ncbi:GDP-mannose 4,6-dehydratase [Streptococcus mitis]|jgi:hypothetical protein|uniref:dTDP-glucose 4,6-dehydratase n=1 Tax=Streptococcus TaxID=1301 RepID=UPI0014954262|nr:GDP-mannose 4,6-dehydratase [Streptococcus sp. CCUG 49591]MBR9644761.1 GDP-mannose 4,6-dehydratase [Streptococcus sp. 11-4097]
MRLFVASVFELELSKQIDERADLIVHFAAESFNGKSIFVKSNIVGTHNFLDLARKYDIRFHHISTDEVYGDFPLENKYKFTEKTQYNLSSPYAATKASADLLVKAWVRSFGVRATISNCSNNYGPYQNPEKFIPRKITNLLTGQEPVLYGAGLNIRDWIHVKDHCRAIDTIIDKGVIGETYLIGVNNERTNVEVLQKISLQLGKSQDDFKYTANRSGHDLRCGINASKLYTELGFTPLYVDFDKGLKEDILRWYQEHEDWWQEMIVQKSENEGDEM